MLTPPQSTTDHHAAAVASRPAIVASDGELLRLFAQKSGRKTLGGPNAEAEAAFALLIERHGEMVWRVCRRVLIRRHDAEDAYQATLLLLARRARSIRSSESMAGWLFRVALRTARHAQRRRAKQRTGPLEHEPPSPPQAEFPDLCGRATAAALMQELDLLPAKYRTPLVLRYLEGRSRRDIADQTDSTIAAVQGNLARGKAMLRGRLLRRGVSLSAAMAAAFGAEGADAAAPHLISQTASNATAVAAGGSLAASVTVVSLYTQGMRAMLISQFAKPIAASAVACVIAVGLILPTQAGPPQVAPAAEPSLLRDAAKVSTAPDDSPAVAFKPAAVEAYHEVYYVSDLLRGSEPTSGDAATGASAKGDPTPEALNALRDRIAKELQGLDALMKISIFPQNGSLVIAAPQPVHERIADLLQVMRNEATEPDEDSATPELADVGAQISIAWTTPVRAENGTYQRGVTAAGGVNQDGVARLTLNAFDELGNNTNQFVLTLIAAGKSAAELEEDVRGYFEKNTTLRGTFKELVLQQDGGALEEPRPGANPRKVVMDRHSLLSEKAQEIKATLGLESAAAQAAIRKIEAERERLAGQIAAFVLEDVGLAPEAEGVKPAATTPAPNATGAKGTPRAATQEAKPAPTDQQDQLFEAIEKALNGAEAMAKRAENIAKRRVGDASEKMATYLQKICQETTLSGLSDLNRADSMLEKLVRDSIFEDETGEAADAMEQRLEPLTLRRKAISDRLKAVWAENQKGGEAEGRDVQPKPSPVESSPVESTFVAPKPAPTTRQAQLFEAIEKALTSAAANADQAENVAGRRAGETSEKMATYLQRIGRESTSTGFSDLNRVDSLLEVVVRDSIVQDQTGDAAEAMERRIEPFVQRQKAIGERLKAVRDADEAEAQNVQRVVKAAPAAPVETKPAPPDPHERSFKEIEKALKQAEDSADRAENISQRLAAGNASDKVEEYMKEIGVGATKYGFGELQRADSMLKSLLQSSIVKDETGEAATAMEQRLEPLHRRMEAIKQRLDGTRSTGEVR